MKDIDLAYITACLGRTPKGLLAVAARDKQGRPSVITNQPLIHERQSWLPFPTLYWLVDPVISSAVAEVERKGGVRAIEQALQEDESLLEQHLEDNRRYAATRWALLSDSDKALAEQHGLIDVLRDSGIGGVANHEAIKCLHAQYAYHLARYDKGTTVGRLIEEHYSLSFKL